MTGHAVRVVAREDARAQAAALVPDAPDPRSAQTTAYRTMPEHRLLRLQRVVVDPGWLDRRRVRVTCGQCGEGVNDERERRVGGRVLCRGCAGQSYYALPRRAGTRL